MTEQPNEGTPQHENASVKIEEPSVPKDPRAERLNACLDGYVEELSKPHIAKTGSPQAARYLNAAIDIILSEPFQTSYVDMLVSTYRDHKDSLMNAQTALIPLASLQNGTQQQRASLIMSAVRNIVTGRKNQTNFGVLNKYIKSPSLTGYLSVLNDRL